MSKQGLAASPALAEFAAALLRQKESVPRAKLIAQHVSDLLDGANVVVYAIETADEQQWVAMASVGEVELEATVIALGAGTLGRLAEKKEPLFFEGSKLAREDYAHLNIVRTLLSLAYLPLVHEDELVGAIELVSFDQPLREAAVATAGKLAPLAALGMVTAADYERERNRQLDSVARLSQLYDLEKTFNSTLEIDELLPIITSKFYDILDCQAVNLWMVGEDALVLTNRAGVDDTVALDSLQASGQGIAAAVSDSGEPLLIEFADDGRLAGRNREVEEGRIFSLMAAPIMAKEDQVGVVEVINKSDGTPFDEDDLFLLNTLCEAAAGALHNASMLQAERKVEILQTLVQISTEITSTLHLDRMAQAIVNAPQAVIPYERAALALEQHGKLRLQAVSGLTQLNPADPDLARLHEMLQWASVASNQVFVTQHEEEIDDPRPESREKFRVYFEATGMRAFYALPLVDEEGRVGILSFESNDPDFLTKAHLEMIKVLGGQATVALRNASLYKEVPFIGILEPILEKKRKFFALEKHRRQAVLVLAAAIVLFLVVVPIPMRVDGEAGVAPLHTARVQPEVEGVVRKVYVREGDPVKRGTILADMEDWNERHALAGAEARHNSATAEMNRALAANDGTEAGIQRLQVEYWAAEVGRARERLARTRLRSPIDGVVATPHIENFAGRKLAEGDAFAEIVDNSRAVVDVAIDERELGLLREGSKAAVKLQGFPTRTFPGRVVVVSPRSMAEGDQRMFYARVDIANPEGMVRPGMQGRAKVSAGWHSAGYVLLRRPGMWFWSKLWNWVGW
jgi:RND family efflux transporter MFP subunit